MENEIKLSEMLAKWRSDRPDEWRMDEFIRLAKKLEQQTNNQAVLEARKELSSDSK